MFLKNVYFLNMSIENDNLVQYIKSSAKQKLMAHNKEGIRAAT
jgi:hypothetical protein